MPSLPTYSLWLLTGILAVSSGCTVQTSSAQPVDELQSNRGPRGSDAGVVPSAATEVDEGDDAGVAETGEPLGKFQFTYYWMATEGKKRKANTQLYTMGCKKLAKVSSRFASRLSMEGTGKLRDGRVLNVAGLCDCKHSPCYFQVSKRQPWGVGVARRSLSPFRSVAVDPRKVAIGTMIYVPELDGLTMPGRPPWGGFVHDGCLIADDRGGGIKGKQIDFFTARRSHYHAIHRRHRIQSVSVFDGKGRCEKTRENRVVGINRNSI